MKHVSKQWSGTLFTLKGIGEEYNDQWVKYYKDGKVQVERREEWLPPEFDETKLK